MKQRTRKHRRAVRPPRYVRVNRAYVQRSEAFDNEHPGQVWADSWQVVVDGVYVHGTYWSKAMRGVL